MYEYIVMSGLVILLLARLYSRAIKRLKEHKHDATTIRHLKLAKEELYDKNFEQQRAIMILEYRIEHAGKEIERQKLINLTVIDFYECNKRSIDIPLKHARFFDYHQEKEDLMFTFSEN